MQIRIVGKDSEEFIDSVSQKVSEGWTPVPGTTSVEFSVVLEEPKEPVSYDPPQHLFQEVGCGCGQAGCPDHRDGAACRLPRARRRGRPSETE